MLGLDRKRGFQDWADDDSAAAPMKRSRPGADVPTAFPFRASPFAVSASASAFPAAAFSAPARDSWALPGMWTWDQAAPAVATLAGTLPLCLPFSPAGTALNRRLPRALRREFETASKCSAATQRSGGGGGGGAGVEAGTVRLRDMACCRPVPDGPPARPPARPLVRSQTSWHATARIAARQGSR